MTMFVLTKGYLYYSTVYICNYRLRLIMTYLNNLLGLCHGYTPHFNNQWYTMPKNRHDSSILNSFCQSVQLWVKHCWLSPPHSLARFGNQTKAHNSTSTNPFFSCIILELISKSFYPFLSISFYQISIHSTSKNRGFEK